VDIEEKNANFHPLSLARAAILFTLLTVEVEVDTLAAPFLTQTTGTTSFLAH
jgi:adenine-specific DNA methylase